MSKKNKQDSGFSLSDDEDFDTMFDDAANSAEDVESESTQGFSSSKGSNTDDLLSSLSQGRDVDSDEEVEQTEPVVAEPTETEIEDVDVENVPELEHSELADELEEAFSAATEDPVGSTVATDPETTPEEISSPPEQEKNVVEPPIPEEIEIAPVAQNTNDDRRRSKVRVPTEKDQIASSERVIRIVDAYRNLSEEEKDVTIQFVTNGEFSEATDGELVVKVLNADPMLTTTMRALRDVYEYEPVERAFFTMSLETRILHALGSLIEVFSSETYDDKQDNLSFSRQVVAAIQELGDREIGFVRATEKVLSAVDLTEDE